MKPIHTLPITAAFLFAACNPGTPTASPTPKPDAEESGPQTFTLSPEVLENAALEFANAEAAEIKNTTRAFGEIALNTEKVATIVSKIEGVLVKDLKQLGDPVEPDEPVAIIESQSLAASIVAYLQTERDLRFARAEYFREKELFEKKLTSSESYFKKEQDYNKAQIAHAANLQPLELLHFAEGQLHGYLDDPDSANLTSLDIRSPIAGVVTKKSFTLGEAVSADRELFVIADLTDVWADFHVPLSVATGLQKNAKVVVTRSGGNETGTATIKYIAPLADEATRTVLVRATLDNSAGQWRPGTPVAVTFTLTSESAPVAVPAEALLDFEGGFIVFVHTADDTFELREVVPGTRDDQRVAIKTGLAAGETVVSTNAYLLKAQWQIGEEG